MGGSKPISGNTSWSKTAVQSQTVADYVEKKGKRPKLEASTTGEHLRILTGANVLRKREWTFKGVALGFWGGLKTFVQTVSTARYWIKGAGNMRRRKNAVLDAGQKFDGGINKLVEDMAKDKTMLDRSSGQMKFDNRVEALYQQAKILKEMGGFSDGDIAERFHTNLKESLRVLQKEGKDGDYDRVLEQLTQKVLPQFEESVMSSVNQNRTDKDANRVLEGLGVFKELQEELTFDRAVVAALHDVAAAWGEQKYSEALLREPEIQIQIQESKPPSGNRQDKKIDIDTDIHTDAHIDSGQEIKADIDSVDPMPANVQAGDPDNAQSKSMVSRLTGGRTLDDVATELGKLSDEDDESLSEQTYNLLSALYDADQPHGVLLPGSAASIALRASDIMESDAVQNGDYADLKAMLKTLILNAQKYE